MGQYGSQCSCMSRPKKQIVSEWEMIGPKLKRGDIVLMSGTAGVSKIIKTGTMLVTALNGKAKEYSHIAIVVEPPFSEDAVGESWELPYMAEAIDNLDIMAVDVSGEVKTKQVHIVATKQRVFGVDETGRSLYSKAAVRRLANFDWTDERIEAFNAKLNEIKGRPLNQTVRCLTNYIYDVGNGAVNDITCCEVVVELYKSIGLLPKNTNPRKFAPFHFSQNVSEVKLELGAYLDDEIVVLPDSISTTPQDA